MYDGGASESEEYSGGAESVVLVVITLSSRSISEDPAYVILLLALESVLQLAWRNPTK